MRKLSLAIAVQGLGSEGQRLTESWATLIRVPPTEALVNVDRACPPKVSGIHSWHIYLFNVGSIFDAVSPSTVFLQKTNTSKF